MAGETQVDEVLDAATALVKRLRDEPDDEGVVAELTALATGPHGSRVREHLDMLKREELLEVQWALEDVLDAASPKKPEPEAKPEPEPEPEEEDDADRPLTAADLNLVYDDPRGLMLYKSKRGDRWFATQVDPRTGQPQTFELHPQEIAGIKQQLAGSPYWLVGG